MTHEEPIYLADPLHDGYENNWPAIARLLTNRPCLVAGQNLNTFKTNANALSAAIAECYELSDEKADIVLRNIIEMADSFDSSAAMQTAMSRYWTELSGHNFNMIAGSRAKLVSALQNRYRISRKTAWKQVNEFFTRLNT